nr:putative Ig domain-containing protein [Pectobacterium colocasium]
MTLSREVNQPPVGHAELFTPPTAQVGTRWSYTLPNSLFSDAENDALTLSINGLPNGLTFDTATRTIRRRSGCFRNVQPDDYRHGQRGQHDGAECGADGQRRVDAG